MQRDQQLMALQVQKLAPKWYMPNTSNNSIQTLFIYFFRMVFLFLSTPTLCGTVHFALFHFFFFLFFVLFSKPFYDEFHAIFNVVNAMHTFFYDSIFFCCSFTFYRIACSFVYFRNNNRQKSEGERDERAGTEGGEKQWFIFRFMQCSLAIGHKFVLLPHYNSYILFVFFFFFKCHTNRRSSVRNDLIVVSTARILNCCCCFFYRNSNNMITFIVYEISMDIVKINFATVSCRMQSTNMQFNHLHSGHRINNAQSNKINK